MAEAAVVRWQNKSIPAQSDFRGVLVMGLLAAWFFFLWQLFSLPPFAAEQAKLPPLLQFALAKGLYMPDFGMILAGFCAFHFRRELRDEWNSRVARRLYLRVLLPLFAYLILALILFEVVHLLGPDRNVVVPWQDHLLGIEFRVVATAAIAVILLPPFLYWMWTSIPDFGWAGIALCFTYYGMTFHLHTHRLLWMWPPTAIVDFVFGVVICSSLFRGVEYLVAVRGPAIILGWVALLAGTIVDGPTLFFLGFIMIVGGASLSERSWFVPGEQGLLLWSRTAFAIALVQPAVLTAWAFWGSPPPRSPWLAGLGLATVTQILAVLLFLAAEPPARRLLRLQPA
jgi:hypothetical protein